MIQQTLGFVPTVCVAAGLLQAHRSPREAYENELYTGDEIKVKFLPARNGSPPGFLETVIRPDGRVIQISAGNPND
jgi:hypothetical protein